MSRKVKIGVVGAGVFGGYHAGKCAAHPRVDYIGTYDKSFERAQAVAEPKGGKAFLRYAHLLSSCDAIIIATPASQHGETALRALKSGAHCLIEKPIATTVAAARRCIDAAHLRGLVLQIGHQERFVAKAIGLDKITEKPLRIDACRHGPYSVRGTDVSVTLDLMIHDIDMVLWLMGEGAGKITGHSITGQSMAVRSNTPDAALAYIDFGYADFKPRARLSASRVEAVSERVMTLTYPSGQVVIDFNAKTLRQSPKLGAKGFDLDANFGDNPMARDSLGAATDSFICAILDGTPVEITGEHGLRALEAALIVDGTL